METFMATRIEEAREISLEKGQAKYRAYFVRKSIVCWSKCPSA